MPHQYPDLKSHTRKIKSGCTAAGHRKNIPAPQLLLCCLFVLCHIGTFSARSEENLFFMTTEPGFHQTEGCFSSDRKGHLFSWCTWMPENCCSFPYFPLPPRIPNGTLLMFVLWTSSSLIPGLTRLHKSNCTLGLQTSGGREGVSFYFFFFLTAGMNSMILLQSSLPSYCCGTLILSAWFLIRI